MMYSFNDIVLNHREEEGTQPPHRKKGLYFIGQVNANPFTNEKFYWLKVGMTTTTFCKRMRGYDSANPMIWKIDFLECDVLQESNYHNHLAKIAYELGRHSCEWFRVSEQEYLEACMKGFNYFEKF